LIHSLFERYWIYFFYSPQTSTTNSASIDYDSSKRINNNSNRTGKDDDDLINKCPTCFMIFPSHMSLADRNQHAGEHFKDSL
jgi:cellulose biosynthesis protein BcsQ